MNTIIERYLDPPPQRDPAEMLTLERGTMADYRALATFHYRGRRPGAVTRVDRLTHHAPTVIGRFFKRREETTVVGVIVRTLPHLACALRDVATNGRYRALTMRERATLLNREVRTIARVVIDPQWRGVGLAVRLVRHALQTPEPGVIYTEALAAMGRVHPFFERAGMMRYERPPHPHDARLLAALERLGIAPVMLAAPGAILARVRRMYDAQQVFFEHELAVWHRAAGRRTKRAGHEPPVEAKLLAARDRLLTRPLYYLWLHNRQDRDA